MFVNDYQVFSWKYLKSSQKSSAASYTPETFYALSHSIHGRGMKKNVNAKCGYVMQKYYLCSRKAAPDCTGVYSQPQKKKKERCSSGWRGTPGKRVYVKSVSGVRIPLFPL